MGTISQTHTIVLPPKLNSSRLKRSDCCSLKMMLQAETFVAPDGVLPFTGVRKVCDSCRAWEDRTHCQEQELLNHLFGA